MERHPGKPGLLPRERSAGGTSRHLTVTSVLLLGGILSSALYLAMDVIAARTYEGYSYKSQTISELSAVGAPTRATWIPLGIVYEVLVFAFGVGVWRSAGRSRALRTAGGLLVVFATVGLAWPFAPMHRREVLAAGGSTLTDTMHLVLAGMNVLLTMLIIAFGAAAFGKRFRLYSITTILALLGFGAVVALDAPKIQHDEPTPWAGIMERVNVFGFMLWFAVLANALLRGHGQTTPNKGRGTRDLAH